MALYFSSATNDIIGLLVFVVGIGVGLMYLGIKWLSTYLERDQKEKYLYWTLVTSPIWLTVSILEVIYSLPSLTSGDFYPQNQPVTILAMTVVTFTAIILASYPAGAAFSTIYAWQLTTPPVSPNKGSALASLEKRVGHYRNVTILTLLFSIAGVLLLNIYLLNLVQLQYGKFGDQLFWLFWFVSGVVLISVIAEERNRYSRNTLLTLTDHPENEDTYKLLESVAITAGIAVPSLKVLPTTNPNAFTLQPIGKEPTIYITSALLDLLSDNEMKAVLAHEVAHITLGRSLNYEMVHGLTTLLKILGFLLFIIFLATIHPAVPIFWGALVLRSYLGQREEWSGEKSSFAIIANFLNPPYLLIQFLSYVLYYALSFQEDYLADLKAMDLTRYPEPLYTLIQKLDTYRVSNDFLPSEFYQLYFHGDNSCISTVPMPIPVLSERWELIRQVDPLAANMVNQPTSPDTVII